MNTCFLLLGTNLGDRIANLARATELLEHFIGDILKTSAIYETQPWGKTNQPLFLNQVIQITTDLKPLDLLMTTQQLEEKMGREPSDRWDARIIDLDILYYENICFQSEKLTIPHLQIPFRRFTLVPLSEIAPDFVHPQLQKTNQMLLNVCEDKLQVNKYK